LILDGIHLKQCVTLYLFSLPFTMVHELGWATVPIVTVVSFTFMGIEGIAEQIEMPFGKHVYFHFMANTLAYSVQALMKLISRWVGLHTSLVTSCLSNVWFTDRYCSDLKEEIK
jgi:predicted membrane chloride channel (bestrophin family)